MILWHLKHIKLSPGIFSWIILKNVLLNRWFVHYRFPDKYISHGHSRTSVTHWRDAQKLSAAALSAHHSFLALCRFFQHQFDHMQKLSNCILFLFKKINIKRNWKNPKKNCIYPLCRIFEITIQAVVCLSPADSLEDCSLVDMLVYDIVENVVFWLRFAVDPDLTWILVIDR